MKETSCTKEYILFNSSDRVLVFKTNLNDLIFSNEKESEQYLPMDGVGIDWEGARGTF